jgi:hypothetical protein
MWVWARKRKGENESGEIKSLAKGREIKITISIMY